MQQNQTRRLTKRERRQFKKEHELKKQQKSQRRQRTKKIGKKILVIFVIAAFVGPAFLLILPSIRTSNDPSEIISRNGIHWHSELLIYINNEKQDIPPNIGAGVVHSPIHTHESDGVIHLEFPGIVKENDLRLSKFFKMWRKDFNSECIFDKCKGPDGQLKMLVNGRENSDFENYIMKDGDKIKIVFENETNSQNL